MTMKNISNVPQKESKLGLEVRVKARYNALHLLGFVTKKWNRQMIDPSNSIPYSEASVTGLNKLQKIFSDMLATKNKEIPDPNP